MMESNGPRSVSVENKVEIVEKYDPRILPIEIKSDVIIYNQLDDYIPDRDDVVQKVFRELDLIDKITRKDEYVMTSEIAALKYFFKLASSENKNLYHLSFKTIEYEYAVTNLDDESTQKLFEKISDFLETAFLDSEMKMSLVENFPSFASYTANDVEECVAEILRNTKEFSEDDLRENYKGYKIFDLYRRTFNKNYNDINYSDISKSDARSRYFRAKFNKYFKNWVVDNETSQSLSFLLERKK